MPTDSQPPDAMNDTPREDTPRADVALLVADVSQRLQVTSASIKAAISSLLDNSIIWDRSAQREFMQTIDESIDQVSGVMAAMSLAMQSESGVLRFSPEPSSIPEILFRVADGLQKDTPGVAVELALPGEGKPALVDYDYLRIALKMLLEALIAAGGPSSGRAAPHRGRPAGSPPLVLRIRAEQTAAHWQIHVSGEFAAAAGEMVAWLAAAPDHLLPPANGINPETRLKAFAAAHLLRQQRIRLMADESSGPAAFTLEIPYKGERWTSAGSY